MHRTIIHVDLLNKHYVNIDKNKLKKYIVLYENFKYQYSAGQGSHEQKLYAKKKL